MLDFGSGAGTVGAGPAWATPCADVQSALGAATTVYASSSAAATVAAADALAAATSAAFAAFAAAASRPEGLVRGRGGVERGARGACGQRWARGG